jgi:hypothetical protein
VKGVSAATFSDLDRHFECLKQARLHRESEWQLIADAFMPRKDFTLRQRPMELRRRRLTSSVPTVGLARGAALLVAHLIDHTRPFIKANVKRGLIAAGRNSFVDKPGQDYLTNLEWTIRDAMMLPRSGFLTAISRMAMELEGFGTAIMWVTRKRGYGPRYQSLPLRACWIGEDEEGMVDTLFYQFSIPIYAAVQRWPNHGIECWRKAMSDEDEDDARERVTITRAVYQRINGIYGAVGPAKPFAEVYYMEKHKTILEESGYDSFPGAVPRLNVEEGSAYGTGMAWQALPEALVLNALQDGIERGVALKLDPPLMVPKRMFAKALDRRPGTVQTYDPASLSFMNAQQAIQRLDIAGDVTLASDYLRRLEQNVEQAFFIDWMRLRDSGTMTAEEVRERRNMRISAMSAIVPGVDRDLMGPTADRTLEILNAEGYIDNPPESLGGVDVEWDYLGPLAIAQLKGQADAISQAMQAAQVARDIDPQSAYVFDVEEGLRAIAEALALPPATTRSREAVATKREQDAQAATLAQNAQLMTQAAAAVRDGGQGVNSLQMALGGGAQGGGGAMPTAA